jgi:hypothetical protein
MAISPCGSRRGGRESDTAVQCGSSGYFGRATVRQEIVEKHRRTADLSWMLRLYMVFEIQSRHSIGASLSVLRSVMPPVDLSVEETQHLTALLADLQGEAVEVCRRAVRCRSDRAESVTVVFSMDPRSLAHPPAHPPTRVHTTHTHARTRLRLIPKQTCRVHAHGTSRARMGTNGHMDAFVARL